MQGGGMQDCSVAKLIDCQQNHVCVVMMMGSMWLAQCVMQPSV